jgi:hypothetical protein
MSIESEPESESESSDKVPIKNKNNTKTRTKIQSKANIEIYNADVNDDVNDISDNSEDDLEDGLLTDMYENDIGFKKTKKNLSTNSQLQSQRNSSIMYVGKKSDTKYIMSKKSDGYVPITFDNVLELSANYHILDGNIIFNKIGLYKITCHIVYSGISCLKSKAYLLLPIDNIKKSSYDKDRKIMNSKMSLFGSSLQKNRLHYDFIVRVNDPLSTMVFVISHKVRNASTQVPVTALVDDKEIIIYGRNKTWILAESLN